MNAPMMNPSYALRIRRGARPMSSTRPIALPNSSLIGAVRPAPQSAANEVPPTFAQIASNAVLAGSAIQKVAATPPQTKPVASRPAGWAVKRL